MSSIQHLKSNQEQVVAYIFFFSINLQERFIKIQLIISKSYVNLRHGSALSKLWKLAITLNQYLTYFFAAI